MIVNEKYYIMHGRIILVLELKNYRFSTFFILAKCTSIILSMSISCNKLVVTFNIEIIENNHNIMMM